LTRVPCLDQYSKKVGLKSGECESNKMVTPKS
jgi:hypothetical protein